MSGSYSDRNNWQITNDIIIVFLIMTARQLAVHLGPLCGADICGPVNNYKQA